MTPNSTQDSAAPQGKRSLQTVSAFVLFSALLATLFLFTKKDWERQLLSSQRSLDSLENHARELEARISFMHAADAKRSESLLSNEFDSFDQQGYRMYGLYRDPSKKQTREQLSNQFNVYNASAISYSEVKGERWFVIPVKGVHYLQADETLTDLAEKYYGSAKDTALISRFNPKIIPYRFLFIPFGD